MLLGAKAALAAGLLFAAADSDLASGQALRPLERPSAALTAQAARLEPTEAGGVRLSVSLSAPAETQMFTLEGPDRVVVDFPQLDWAFHAARVVAAAPPVVRARGVDGLRVAQFRQGRSRLVLDLGRSLRAAPPRFVPTGGDGGELILELAPEGRATPTTAAGTAPTTAAGTAAATAAGTAAAPAAPGALATRAAALEIDTRPDIETRSTPSIAAVAPDAGRTGAAPLPQPRPEMFVVVVDAGHGGVDPGAVYGGRREKDLVLDVALALRDQLAAAPGVAVVMTRERDVGLSLDQRVEIARRAGADLFVSVHADALPEHPEISGAAFYTLADRASDAYARRLAQRENGDAGLPQIREASGGSWARRLLIDYAQRRAVAHSHHLVERLLSDFAARGVPLLGSSPHREAGFRVLRTFDQPSLLVELGFLTNLKDRRRFGNPAWRETVVQAMAAAILSWRDETAAPARAGAVIGRVRG